MSNTEQPSRVVTVKLPPGLDRELTELARKRRSSRSAVVREALTSLARKSRRSVITAAGDLVGSLKGAAPDLSVNKRHLSHYGK